VNHSAMSGIPNIVLGTTCARELEKHLGLRNN
jgi:hypothetical protein